MPAIRPHTRRYWRILAAALLAAALAGAYPSPGAAAATGTSDPGARCRRLEARIALLQGRLRMGYTARQGRLWRQQMEALEAERRAACR